MAYDINKLTRLNHLKSLAQKVATECATKTELNALSSRIDDIVSVGGEPNVIEGVKVNGTALAIAEKMVDILIASGSANGTIAVNNVDVAITGLAALAYKSEVSEAELAAALKATIDGKAAQSDVTALQTAITTLNGTGEGSVKKTVDDAINEFATNVTDDAVVNSYKELIDWVAQHGPEAAEMSAAIQTNASDIAALETLVGTLPEVATSTDVVSYIAEAIAAIGISNYYTKTEADAAITAALASYYTKTEIDAKFANYSTTEQMNAAIKVVDDKFASYYTSAQIDGMIATDTEVTEMLDEVFAAEVTA